MYHVMPRKGFCELLFFKIQCLLYYCGSIGVSQQLSVDKVITCVNDEHQFVLTLPFVVICASFKGVGHLHAHNAFKMFLRILSEAVFRPFTISYLW